jgi:aminoglycoside phosphotransferase family enzyme
VPAAAVTLERKVEHLRSLCGPGDEAIETHFAWVFLAGDRAWKLRKPVRRDPMDYGTLEARRHGSLEELRLNRRLAPEVYLRVVPMNVDDVGQLSLDGPGEPVDWLVCMRRLQRRRQLDAVLASGTPDVGDLRALARLLARFYRDTRTVLASGDTCAGRLRRQIDANGRVLVGSSVPGAAELSERQRAWVDRHAAELERRLGTGCLVEGHGDLRPEHVFLNRPPVVIDCLEFDRDLRLLDRAEELCFFEMECGRSGHAATGRALREQCLQELGDAAPAALLDFYRGHRAATRAKLCVWRSAEPDGADRARWFGEAAHYVEAGLDDARRAAD